MRKISLTFVIIIALEEGFSTPSDPVWPDNFEIWFNETNYLPIENMTAGSSLGQMLYSFENNWELIKRADGSTDKDCFMVLQGVATECNQWHYQDLLYVELPNLEKCCMLCTAQQGSRLLKKDWMNGSEYLGIEKARCGYLQVLLRESQAESLFIWALLG